ncbi:MAG: phosphoglycerate mutase [Candidatus Aenigmatarchaeota archaeon]
MPKTKKKKIKMVRRVKPKVTKLRRKIIFLVIDGLPDLPEARTPLAIAYKPNLDFFAKNGMCGEILTVEKKFWNDIIRTSVSHLANFSLLGYDVKPDQIKRGPIEAVGANIPYQQGWLALRCNFTTVDNELKVLDRRVGRNFQGLDEIARYINEHVKLDVDHIFMRTYGHRAVLILKEKLSDKISDSDPYFDWEKVKKIEAFSPEAGRSAQIVQDFIEKSRQVIEYHPANEQRIKCGLPPANYILTREAGNRLPIIKNFLKKNNIQKAVCIAENGVMKGSCMLAGFDSITVPELNFEQTLRFIFDNIENALAEYDFVYAHIKGPDESAHDGDFFRKQKVIERIDDYLGRLRYFDGILIITSDHITSCKTRKHEFGPVPILVYGKGIDNVQKFDELSVKKGKIGLINGKNLWKIVLGR